MANARHHASQLVRHHAQLETRAVRMLRTSNYTNKTDQVQLKGPSDDSPFWRVWDKKRLRRTILVHQYKNNGYDIVMDVNSGAIHVVDDVVYDAIAMLEEKLVHWMSHNQIDMFLYMLKHIETEEQALAFGRQAMAYLVTGWFALFGVDLTEK